MKWCNAWGEASRTARGLRVSVHPLHALGMVGLPRHLRIVQAVIRHSTERAPRRGHLDLYSSIPSVEGHDPALIYHGALI